MFQYASEWITIMVLLGIVCTVSHHRIDDAGQLCAAGYLGGLLAEAAVFLFQYISCDHVLSLDLLLSPTRGTQYNMNIQQECPFLVNMRLWMDISLSLSRTLSQRTLWSLPYMSFACDILLVCFLLPCLQSSWGENRTPGKTGSQKAWLKFSIQLFCVNQDQAEELSTSLLSMLSRVIMISSDTTASRSNPIRCNWN